MSGGYEAVTSDVTHFGVGLDSKPAIVQFLRKTLPSAQGSAEVKEPE
jgi:hypothetical protein